MQEKGLPRGGRPDVEKAYRALGPELRARFYARCADRELALEAVQQAFLKLLEEGREPIDDLRAWLHRVGRNWLADVGRRRLRRREAGLEEIPGSIPGPASAASSAEQHDLVRRGLARLRPDERELLALRYGLDWPSRRIAAALDLTVGAVDMRISRARTRLARWLSVSGVDHGSE